MLVLPLLLWLYVAVANGLAILPRDDIPQKSKALSILLQQIYYSATSPVEQRWLVFGTKYQEAVGCRSTQDYSLKGI